jgi:hypothetical protein
MARRNLRCSISSIRRRNLRWPGEIFNELLPHKCPNWFHGELAKRASQQVEGLDVKALHMAMMVHCTGRFHQYSSNDFLDNCEQAIMQAMKISDLDETGLSSAMQAIVGATKAIPTLSAAQSLKFEEDHWELLKRYRPQIGKLAHTLASDGKVIDFNNEAFVKEW